MNKLIRFLSLLAITFCTVLALKSQNREPVQGIPSRLVSTPVIVSYTEAMKMKVSWAAGMKKKKLKKIKLGLNPASWPQVFGNAEEMEANSFNLGRFYMYSVCRFSHAGNDYRIVFIPEAENRNMPVEMRPLTDLYLCVTNNSVNLARLYNPELDGAIARYYSPQEFYPGKYQPCRIMKPEGILPSEFLYNHQGWREFVQPYMKEDVILFSKESNMPAVLLDKKENRFRFADRIPFYACNAIAEFYINGTKTSLIEILEQENRHMPEVMMPQTMYLLVADSALDKSRGWNAELDGNPEKIRQEELEGLFEESEPIVEIGLDVVIGKGEEVACYIVDRGELYSEAGIEEFRKELTGQLPNFDEVSRNIVQTAWPSGINNLEKREDNDARFIDYKAYAVARIAATDQIFYIVKIKPEDNKHMPADMIPSKTIYFLFGAAGLSLEKQRFVAPVINEVAFEEDPVFVDSEKDTTTKRGWKIAVSPGSKTRVYIVDRGKLYSTLDVSMFKDEIEEYMGVKYQDVLKFGNETNWPSGIAKLENREKRDAEFKQYSVHAVARFGRKYYVLEVNPEENKSQPADMQLLVPFYFIMDEDGISTGKP
jgi:hypothetical protein